MCVITPNFMQIDHTVSDIWPYFDFSEWRLSAILDLFCASLDHPRRAFGGLYSYAKFGWNRCSCFDNMQILLFSTLGLTMPIHAPLLRVLGL